MYLHGLGLTSNEWINLSAQRTVLVQQLQAAQQALYVCMQNDPNGSCHDGNVTNAVPALQAQIAAIDALLAQGITPDTYSVPQPVGPSVPSAVPPSAGTPASPALLPVNSNALAPSAGASPFSPTDIDVQSVTGNTSALMPGSAGEPAGAAPQKSNAGLILALLAAAAALMGG